MRQIVSILAALGVTGCNDPAPTVRTDEAIPDSWYCGAVRDWDSEWSAWEAEVVELVNERREQGAVCGGVEYYPRPPLEVDDALRCAARKHALDMQHRDYVAHRSPDGSLPSDRIRRAGYRPRRSAENIAVVSHPVIPLPDAAEAVLDAAHIRSLPSPERAVDLWMHSPRHCETIMSDGFEHTGAGYVLTAEGAPIFIQAFAGAMDSSAY